MAAEHEVAAAERALLEQNINQLYESAKVSKTYYGRRLVDQQRKNTGMEIIIAVGATGSGASGVAAILIGFPGGKLVWGVVTLVSTVLAISKPFLRFEDKIQHYTKKYTEYSSSYSSFDKLIRDIKSRTKTLKIQRQYNEAEAAYADLEKTSPPPASPKLYKECEETVRKEMSRP